MRLIRSLAIYIAAVFIGGALLAPWLYHLAQAAAPLHPALAKLAGYPFGKFVNRALLLLALGGLWPLLRSLGATSAREAGLVRLSGQGRPLLAGFLLGFASLAVTATIIVACDGRMINHDHPAAKYAKSFFGAALTAVGVALLEEILFRGGIFGGLRRAMDWRVALGLSSLIFGILHFLKSEPWNGAVTWHSGLEQLPLMACGFTNWQKVIPGFFNLTLVGALLALAYQRTGNLWFSIGLHGGWVFWLKFYGTLTVAAPGADARFWGSARLVDGWMVCFMLLAVAAVLPRLTAKKVSGHERSD